MKSRLIALMILAGCSSASKPPAPVPPPPPPPPPPPVICSWTLNWVNPTENVDDLPLDPDELVAATLYTASIPLAPTEQTEIIDNVPPYVLAWELTNISEGTYYYRLTVSNFDVDSNPQESDHSNEVTKVCD